MNWAFKLISHDATRAIRQAVLWPEKTLEQVAVAGDESALHIGAFVGEQHVGVVSLFFDTEGIQFRKLALLPEFQKSGAGTALLATCTLIASQQGAKKLWCNARQDALGFYTKLGFEIDPEVFAVSGLLYQKAFLRFPYPKILVKDVFIAGVKALEDSRSLL